MNAAKTLQFEGRLSLLLTEIDISADLHHNELALLRFLTKGTLVKERPKNLTSKHHRLAGKETENNYVKYWMLSRRLTFSR